MSFVILISKRSFILLFHFVVSATKPYFVFEGAVLIPPIWGMSYDGLALILYFSFKLFSCSPSFFLHILPDFSFIK